jgi:pimeloyl-ACP methyl ester carboxylesterase
MGRIIMAKELNRDQRKMEADGLSIDYFEAGAGDSVVVFLAEFPDFSDSLLSKLVDSHRVISLNVSSHDSANAHQLGVKLPRALTSLGIEQCSVIGISAGARPALALAISMPERINRLILLSPLQLSEGVESLDLACVNAATMVLVGTRDTTGAIEAARLCRERIHSCHLSFVYGAGHALAADRPEACLKPILQFLEQGEQFIIFRESQVIRP